jgi:hypothetical protein
MMRERVLELAPSTPRPGLFAANCAHTGSENVRPKADLRTRPSGSYLKLKPRRPRSEVIRFDMVISI